MNMERLYRWRDISHWDVRDAVRAGELRAICAGSGCSRIAAIARGAFPGQVPLWVLAQRMRCRACHHRGAEFEVWGSAAAAKYAERHPPPWRDDRRRG